MAQDMNAILYNPPSYILEVVSAGNRKRGKRWTISDIAVDAGIDLNTARRDLLNLASATGFSLPRMYSSLFS